MDTLTLSHSQLESFEQCPSKWYLQKIARMPQAPSDALILGDAVHQSIEADGRRRVFTQSGLTMEAMGAIFTRTLETRLAKDDQWGLLQGKRVEMRSRGLAMLRAYHSGFASDYYPAAVEATFPDVLLEPEDGNSSETPRIRFTGRIDARTTAPRGRNSFIVDFKTAAKPWERGIEHRKPQADAYLWADTRGYERPASGVTFVVMSTCQTGPDGWVSTVETRTTTRTPEQLVAYERRVRAVAGEIVATKAAGQSAFAHNTGPLCGWCGYWSHCEAGKAWLRAKGRTPAVPGVNDRGEPVEWE